MTNKIKQIAIDKLFPHPDNPNTMSKANFNKLVRNIERSGRYEPLVVRPFSVSPCPESQCPSVFQIINGHHRWQALKQLGYKTADVVVWDIDDHEADILLATLNRLGGKDNIEKKLVLLKRLNKKLEARRLAKLLPATSKQIERLTNLLLPSAPAIPTKCFANPLVFFVTDTQQQIIEKALLIVQDCENEKTKASRRAAALTAIARHFLDI